MDFEVWARENVPLLTAALSTLALALVFGAAGDVIPHTIVPDPGETVVDAIPHVNAAISAIAVVTIGLGWRAIRNGQVDRHRVLMGTSFGLFAAFLALYLYRLVLVGTAEFPGPETVYQFVYLPFLGIHILLAIVCIPLLFYVVLLAATRNVAEIYGTNHARVGGIAAPLWLVSFLLGIGVYVLLHHVY